MKQIILLSIFSIFFSFNVSAQHKSHGGNMPDAKKKEIREFKLKFFADEMGLNEEQRKLFNELYTQKENERREIVKQTRKIENELSKNKNATEADYEKANKEISENKAKLAELEKKYDEKFSKFLSKRQIFQMKMAEEKFMKRSLNCVDKKKNKGGKSATACCVLPDSIYQIYCNKNL